jgi:DNA-binding protein HU-beta
MAKKSNTRGAFEKAPPRDSLTLSSSRVRISPAFIEVLLPCIGLGDVMAEARRMGKSELFSHFADRFEMKRTQAREFFDELTTLSEKELKRSGEFVLPGLVKLVVQKRKARMGRNPATGVAIEIPAKTVVKARIAKQLKDAVLPKK